MPSLQDFQDFFAGEWVVVSGAPFGFAAAILAAALLLYWIFRARYQDRLDTLEQRLKLRDDQISQFQSKVGSTSPDEVKARIDALEARVHAIAPRRATEAQKASIKADIASAPGIAQFRYDSGGGDSKSFGEELREVFRGAGWRTSSLNVLSASMMTSTTGLLVIVTDPTNLTSKQSSVVAALRKASIAFDIAPLDPQQDNRYGFGVLNVDDDTAGKQPDLFLVFSAKLDH